MNEFHESFIVLWKPENIKIRIKSNMSLLILTKAIHVCCMINPWFTKFVGSRWQNVSPVLFCLAPFLLLYAPWLRPSHKNAKKEKQLWQCPAILPSRLANNAYILTFKMHIMLFKSYAWVQNRTGAQRETHLKSQLWFQTKIAPHRVQLPLYYTHFQNAKFSCSNTGFF